jgi:hypothetical protein
MLRRDTPTDSEFAARVAEFDKQFTTLRTILEQTLVRIHRELGDIKHWPKTGWDYKTTVGTIEDMLPDVTEKQMELWATDDMNERELWLEGPEGRESW